LIREINIEEALYMKNLVLIDVRSEVEYELDTIPGAINIPLLNNNEHEHVGYVYAQVDKEEAKKIGLKYASYKLTDFYEKAKSIENRKKQVALFCYRGGMRSNSVAKVLDTMGIDLFLIQGGYKSYRKYVIDELLHYKGKFKFIVLHGYTGTGKTKILEILESNGKSILDLEKIAHNAGSVFGDIMYADESNSQKKFESLLLSKLHSVNDSYVFTESESKRVGKAILPDFLYNDMENGRHVLIETSLEKRIENIVNDYVINLSSAKDKEIEEAIIKLRKKLGGNKVDFLIEELSKKNYFTIARELMLNYYDPLYKYSLDKYGNYDKIIEYTDLNYAVNELIAFVDTLY